jgi:hypothetical protein
MGSGESRITCGMTRLTVVDARVKHTLLVSYVVKKANRTSASNDCITMPAPSTRVDGPLG